MQDRFAELTVLLEDLHGVAIEGQHPDMSDDIAKALCASLALGLTQVKRHIAEIRARSSAAS